MDPPGPDLSAVARIRADDGPFYDLTGVSFPPGGAVFGKTPAFTRAGLRLSSVLKRGNNLRI